MELYKLCQCDDQTRMIEACPSLENTYRGTALTGVLGWVRRAFLRVFEEYDRRHQGLL